MDGAGSRRDKYLHHDAPDSFYELAHSRNLRLATSPGLAQEAEGVDGSEAVAPHVRLQGAGCRVHDICMTRNSGSCTTRHGGTDSPK